MDIRSKQTYELLKDIIDTMDITIVVDNIEEISLGKYKIFTSDTKWLTLGYTITIDGNDYKITDLMPNVWVLVTGSVIPDAEAFDIYRPKFDHGDILAQNQKMNSIPNSWSKLPLIWQHEKTNERFINDELSTIDRESDLDLYLLIDNNIRDWMQLDEDRYTLKPMRNLVKCLIDTLKEATNVFQPFEYNLNDAPRFGSYVDSKGNTKQIFKDRVSGCELKLSLEFLKPDGC